MMKIEFVKDGAIQGWVVSFAFTVMTMGLLLAGFFDKMVQDAWKSLGGNYSTIYLGSMGIWLGYRGFKSYTETSYKKIEEGNGSAKFPI